MQLSTAISSLLSESYSRAYRAMVSMQILSEMEEAVEYKQSTADPAIDVDALAATNSFSDLLTFGSTPSPTVTGTPSLRPA